MAIKGCESARAAARALRVRLGIAHRSYVNVERIAEQFQVEIALVPLRGARAQMVWVNGRPPKFRLSDTLSRPEQRFSIAHELAHLTMGDSEDDMHCQGGVYCEQIETAADIFAVDLLLPEHVVRPFAVATMGGMDAALRLGHVFGVPAFAGALRVVDLTSVPCAVVVSERNMVRWVRANERFPGRVLARKRLDERTLASAYFATGAAMAGARRVPAAAWLELPAMESLMEQSIPTHGSAVLTLLWTPGTSP